MTFTNYSPFGAGVAATATIAYRCAPPAAASWIAISTPRVLRSGGNSMQFDVYQDANHATVWPDAPPVPVPLSKNGSATVYGFLPPQDAAAGSYVATLVVSIYTDAILNRTDTATLSVSTSNFLPSCAIGAGTVAFGAYDPVGANAASPLDAQGSFQITCTRNAAFTVGLGAGGFAAGTTRQMANGAQRLPYELYSDAARTSPWTATAPVSGTAPSWLPIPLTVYGRVPAGQAVPAGPYADTVQSTVNF